MKVNILKRSQNADFIAATFERILKCHPKAAILRKLSAVTIAPSVTVTPDDKNYGFGAYDPSCASVYLGSVVPKEIADEKHQFLRENLCHELAHHIQYVENKNTAHDRRFKKELDGLLEIRGIE